MITLEELKKEIDSAIELQNISQAMEQSAASYIVKARNKIFKTRTFFEEAWKSYDITRRLSLPQKDFKRSKVVVAITPDQGLYGNLLIEELDTVQAELNNTRSELIVIGSKGKAMFSQNESNITHHFDLPEDLKYENLNSIIDAISKFSNITIVYPKYISAFEQEITTFTLNDQVDLTDNNDEIDLKRFNFDPNIESVSEYFDKTVIGIIFFRYFIEAMLAYKAAQMIAMKRAHDNAADFLTENKSLYFRSKRELIDGRLRELTASRNLWEDN